MAVLFYDLFSRPVTQLKRARKMMADGLLGTTGQPLHITTLTQVSDFLAYANTFLLGAEEGLLVAANAVPGMSDPSSEAYQAAEAILASIPGAPTDEQGNRTLAGLQWRLGLVANAHAEYRAAVIEAIAQVPLSALLTYQTKTTDGATSMVLVLDSSLPVAVADALRVDSRVVNLHTQLVEANF